MVVGNQNFLIRKFCYYFESRNCESVGPGKLEILRFGNATTSEFLSKIPVWKFERFDVSILNFRDRENQREGGGKRERERERERGDAQYWKIKILNYLLVIVYILC